MINNYVLINSNYVLMYWKLSEYIIYLRNVLENEKYFC